MVASVTPDTLRSYQRWHAALGSDATTAGFWRTNYYLDLGRIALELAVAMAIFIFLKPRPQRGPESERVG